MAVSATTATGQNEEEAGAEKPDIAEVNAKTVRAGALLRVLPPSFWVLVIATTIGLTIAWFLPFGTLEATGSIGGGDDQIVREFSRTVWFWDLPGGTIALLVAPLALIVAAGFGFREPNSPRLIASALIVALAANIYLAASTADPGWRDVPTPAAVADGNSSPRCDFLGFGRSYTSADGSRQRMPTYSCRLGIERPMGELHEEVIDAGYAVSGIAALRKGIGTQLFVTISFLAAVGSGWRLLVCWMSPLRAGLLVAAVIGVVYLVVLFDVVADLR